MKEPGKTIDKPTETERKPSEKSQSYRLRYMWVLVICASLLSWIIVSSTVYFSFKLIGFMPDKTHSTTTSEGLLSRRVDEYLERPLRELRSLALQLDIWVALPEEALQRSLRLASFRNPELTELLVADEEGRVLASFDPSNRLSLESHLTGSLDPHDARRKFVRQKKRTVILVKKKPENPTVVLMAVPLYARPGLNDSRPQGFLDDESTHDNGENTKNTVSYDDFSESKPGDFKEPSRSVVPNEVGVLRGYVAASLPLNPLLTLLEKFRTRPDILEISLSADSPEGVSHYTSSETSHPSETAGLTVRMKKRGGLPPAVLAPGLFSALMVFLLGFFLLFVEKKNKMQ